MIHYLILLKFIIKIVVLGLLFFPLLLVLADTFFRGFFLVIAVFSSKQKKEKNIGINKDLSLFILVVANNEERIIGQELQLVLDSIKCSNFVTLALLADNCTDQTIQIARDLGVNTYIRTGGDPGKGKALSWFTQKNASVLDQCDLIAILDADTIISTNFEYQVQMEFLSDDIKVVQAYVKPLHPKKNPIVILAGYSEILAQKIDDTARSKLGWSVPLKGKGAIFRTKLFQDISRELSTQVDDIEMSICLADFNVQVHYCPAIQVIDLNTEIVLGLARQRGRWLIGQRQIQEKINNKIIKLLRSGPSTWSLIHAMLVKPKIAVLFIKCALLAIALSWNIEGGYYFSLKIFLAFGILVDILYYLIGLMFVEDAWKYFAALLTAPIYLFFWLISFFYSIIAGEGWLRARKE